MGSKKNIKPQTGAAKRAKRKIINNSGNKIYNDTEISGKSELCVETHLKHIIPIIFKNLQTADGWCFDPESDEAKIYIGKQLQNRRKLNVLIEEITHAFFWEMPEYRVRKFSAQLGKIIYHLFIKK